ncbi:hypothetical protein Psfp_03050 [Pelotomaculum sp. FP]|uniref:SIR2 family protein n=1 Tax=Pelotomaculum sp. FP TaxID=261474 RepID=UPI001065A675|nr:SIR2 family protein [Pelotomaculum sp. FP]TEB14229.1 hypothetical protein Psfp_03050 [Pelotomaculum sp. FP]
MAHPAKEYMNILKQAYRRHQLVPFVGAGLSFPFEMPGWGTLLDDVCGKFDYEFLTEHREEISKLIEEHRYLEAVDEMRKAGIGEEDLKASICGAIQRKRQKEVEEPPDNIYKDLAKMNCTKYLTTNYDNYLSEYVGKGPSDISHLFKEFSNEWDDVIHDGAVYNLHGDYTKPSTIVLSRESYNNLYQNSIEFQTVLEHFRERYVLLFIGVSLDDEYIQQVLEVSSERLRARHFILLANISVEKRLEMEKRYDVKILRYSTDNGDHIKGIREILNEIISVSDQIDEQEAQSQILKGSDQRTIYQPQSMMSVKTECLTLVDPTESLPSKDSTIYDKVKEIKKLQKNGQIDEAIAEYNRILQGSIFEPLSTEDKKMLIKGMLYCYILIRDYPSAASLVESAMKLPKCKDDIDLLSCIVDYQFNIGDFESAYKTANEWYEMAPEDPLLLGLKVYTENICTEIPYERAFDMLLNEDMDLIVNTEDDDQRQFIYRLTGEIALHYKMYGDALRLLRRAYEIDDNIFNIEDLGIATYFKAIGEADDGITIKINAVNLNDLSKAVEYFEAGFARAKGSVRRGIHSRVAIPYLRSLFYLRRIMDFDRMSDQLIEYCGDDLYEISRMKAINNIQLNKSSVNDINMLNETDKALISSEFYNMRGMTEHAIQALKPIVDKIYKDNEDILIQFLATLLNAKAKDRFNDYFVKYSEHWNHSDKMQIIKSFYYEVNGEYAEAERTIRDIINQEPSVINYNILITFYRRTGQVHSIGNIYEEVLKDKPELVNQDPDSFYLAYHDYLMKINNIDRAYWLYSNKVKYMCGSDIRKVIEVDLKVRLNDFSGIIESALDIYEKYRYYGETIYAYYASVAYLHYNDLEKSRYYLNLYKANGHVDQQSNILVQKVEGKLDILQKRTEVNGNVKANHIKNIALEAISKNTEILIPKNESIVIDAPAIYALFHLGKERLLEDIPEILIVFTTVGLLHNVYCDCGDELIFKIIEYIRRAENVHITSPSMESMLYSRKNFSNLGQDFYDSFNLTIQRGNPFVTAYQWSFAFQQNALPALLPEGVKTIKIVNNRILIYTGNC